MHLTLVSGFVIYSNTKTVAKDYSLEFQQMARDDRIYTTDIVITKFSSTRFTVALTNGRTLLLYFFVLCIILFNSGIPALQ